MSKMELKKFNLDEEIYIDSNIFIYVILENIEYLKTCTDFLKKVETVEINAVISPLVIDEVCFKIIVERLKSVLDVETNAHVFHKLKNKPELLSKAKPELMTFLFIIENYKGLKILPVHSSSAIKLFSHTLNDNMLPRDALHLSVMDFYGIKNIATSDKDFERIKKIKVWKP